MNAGIGSIKISGDHILVPANSIFCVVLRPSGHIVGASTNEDDADVIAGDFEGLLVHDGVFEQVKAVEVVLGSKLLQEQPSTARIRRLGRSTRAGGESPQTLKVG